MNAFQTVQRFIERFVLDGKLKADEVVYVFVEKGRAGHEGYAQFPDQVLAEGRIVVVAVFPYSDISISM